MKRLFISIIVISLYFFLTIQVFATGTISTGVSSSSINVGDMVNVSVNLSGVSIATLTSKLSFDTQKLQYISGPSNSNVVNGKVIYTWTDPNGGETPKTGGTIATFTFKAISAGTASFSVSGDYFTPDEVSANPAFVGASVNIKSIVVTPTPTSTPIPTVVPTVIPTLIPSVKPTSNPTVVPTVKPTIGRK